jgi:tetratricopeptide (TPR) repeat protein/ferredoxin
MDEPAHRPKRYGRKRAAVLATVYLLMGLHIAHWKIAGRTLAPLELNEVMHTLELGIVTAGFIFMAVAMLSVLIFGRFFCAWGCHILALEDLCSWLLGRIGIRPKPVRSRVLLLVPPAAMFYMFIWPQISRLIEGRPLPQLRVTGEESAWASFLTDDFWRNLPSPTVTVVTFLIVGFVIVYVLGTRSFCRYACPYGAIFAIGDRVAPGRIVAKGDCSGCGICTAKCESHIRVHEELTVFGQVVNPACLKDLDCISNCPEGNIGYGFRRPALFKSWKRPAGVKRPRYDFSLGEDVLMAAVFAATLYIYRGLYGIVPFLLTLALGGILAYGAVMALRLVRSENVRFNNFQLKRAGRITRPGLAAAALAVLLTAVTAHSAVIRYHERAGWRAVDALTGAHDGIAVDEAVSDAAIAHLSVIQRWGLLTPARVPDALADLYAARATARLVGNDAAGAVRELRAAIDLLPNSPTARYNLGVLLAQTGRELEAIEEYGRALRLQPGDADTLNNLGFLLGRRGDLEGAERCFRSAIETDPEHAHAHFNLGRALVSRGRAAEADVHFRRAVELDAAYAAVLEEIFGTE